MAPIVVGLLWKIMLAGSWGLISYNVLERFHLIGQTSIFASSGLALYALIFVDIWQWTPFMMLAFRRCRLGLIARRRSMAQTTRRSSSTSPCRC
jgi:ABC-type sugar transport system permease subunit